MNEFENKDGLNMSENEEDKEKNLDSSEKLDSESESIPTANNVDGNDDANSSSSSEESGEVSAEATAEATTETTSEVSGETPTEDPSEDSNSETKSGNADEENSVGDNSNGDDDDSNSDDDDRPPLTAEELVLKDDFEPLDLLGLESDSGSDENKGEEESTITDVSEPMWYTVHVYTGKENEVKEKVLELKNDKEVGEYIEDVFIPTEVVLAKGSSNTKARKNSYPGYIFVKARITNTSWYRIRNIEHVVGFAGQGSNPIPLTPEEIRRLDIEKVEILYNFNVGDDIKIIRGSFDTFTGKVTEVMQDKEKVKARVLMFGRETELELSYDDIDKI